MWYAGLWTSRTRAQDTHALSMPRPDFKTRSKSYRTYRNPVIYAQELQTEMVRDQLTRGQLASRHAVSSDRITQWLCLLDLPVELIMEIESLGDHWDRQVITERKLRQIRRRTLDLK